MRGQRWEGGKIRGEVYWIDRSIAGRRFQISTRATTRRGALAQLARFEADPVGYVPAPDVAETPIAPILEAYLKHSTATNGPKHVRMQTAAFHRWAAFLSQRGVDTMEGFTAAIANEFIPWRKSGQAGLVERPRKRPKRGADGLPLPPAIRPVHEAAVNRDLAAMKAAMAWAVKTERIREEQNPMRRVELLREFADVNPHRPVSDADLKAVLPHLLPQWADAVILLRASGLRYSSLCGWDASRIYEPRMEVRDPKPKGRVSVNVTIDAEAMEAAKRCCGHTYPDDEAQQFTRRLEVACAKAGVERFTAHDIRHAAATSWHEQGVPLREIQLRLGHADITTTERYLGIRGRG